MKQSNCDFIKIIKTDLKRQKLAWRNLNIMIKLKDKKVAVIDIETTGLDPEIELILEIGIVEVDLLTGETKILFESLVKEPKFGEEHRDAWIFSNSDLKFEDFENAPLLDDLKQKISEILNQYSITAFKKAFDLDFLKAKKISIPKELPCIMLTAQNILKIPYQYDSSRYKRPNVQEAWDFFFPNSEYIEKHRAIDDAIHEAKILFEISRCGQFLI